MSVAYSEDDLETYLTRAGKVSKEYPVVITKFILDAKVRCRAVVFGLTNSMLLLLPASHVPWSCRNSADDSSIPL